MTAGGTIKGFGGSRELGKYRLVNELAKSQLGALWTGVSGDEDRERKLVLARRFDTGLLAGPDQVDQLSEAAWWAMELTQPHIARTINVVKTESELGMVYEFSDGEVLRSLLRLASFKRKPFPVAVALRVALDLLDAVASAREQAAEDHIELACGGLTPDSVLVGTDGTTRLLDVGAAGVVCCAERVLRNPEMAAYAAPEHFEGPSQAQADVFTAGVLIHEMLTGKRLFVGSNFAAVSERVKEAKATRLDASKPVGGEPIPEALADVVARAIQQNASERFANCREMAQALEALPGSPADREQVGEFVEALDGNALATRRKITNRALGKVAPGATRARPVPASAPMPAAAAPPKPASPPPKPASPPPKPKGAGRRAPPPPPRERMESLDADLLEPEEVSPESAGDGPVELESADVPVEVESAAQAEPSDETEAPSTPEADTESRAETAQAVETEAPGEAEPDASGSDPAAAELSEPKLIEALTADSTPQPGTTGAAAIDAGADAEVAPAEAAGPSTAQDDSSPATSSIDEPVEVEATTSDATEESVTVADLEQLDERRQRARRMVMGIVGAMLLLLLVAVGLSALRGKNESPAQASSATPQSTASSAAAAAAAGSVETVPAASAEPTAVDAGETGSGDAAAEAEVEDSGPEAAPSATASSPPPAPPRPVIHHYVKPRPRPKHKFTPSGISTRREPDMDAQLALGPEPDAGLPRTAPVGVGKRMLGRFGVGALLALALVASAPAARAAGASLEAASPAQKKTAGEKFGAGMDAFNANKYDEALQAFQASYDSVASPNSHLMLARALAKLGRLGEAYEAFDKTQHEAEQAAKLDKKYEKAAQSAANERDALRPEIALVTVQVSGAASGAKLTLGGRDIDPADWSRPVAVDPGSVSVVLQSSDGTTTQKQVEASAGGSSTVQIAPNAAAPGTPPAASENKAQVSTSGIDKRTLAYIAGGVGAAGLVTFGVFGVLDNSRYSSLRTPARTTRVRPERRATPTPAVPTRPSPMSGWWWA